MKSIILKFGLIGSVIIVSLFIAQMLIWGTDISYRASEIFGYATILLANLFVFLGIKTYRDQEKNGLISFKEALNVGTLIALLPAGAIFILTALFFQFYGDKFVEYAKKSMTAEQMAQMEANYDLFMNPLFQGMIMFLTVFIIGFGIALISSWVLKREDPDPA